MNEAEFGAVQRGLRARVADELVSSVQTLEADRRRRVSERDQRRSPPVLSTGPSATSPASAWTRAGRSQPTKRRTGWPGR